MIALALFYFINCIYVHLLICCVRPLMYLLLKPSRPPANPRRGCLLSFVIDGLCPGCYKKKITKTLKAWRMRIIWSERIHVKQRCKNNHSILKDVQCMHWETGGHALFLWEREICLKDSEHCGLSSLCGERLLKQPCLFKVADFLSFSNCCFQAVLLWHLSTPPPPKKTSGLKGCCCTLCLFLYCTCKRDTVSVIWKTKKGDRQRARSLRSVTHIFKKINK